MSTPVLALVEVLDRDGRVLRGVPVTHWPLAIGRAIDNDIVLDDPHVAAHHARLDQAAAARYAPGPGMPAEPSPEPTSVPTSVPTKPATIEAMAAPLPIELQLLPGLNGAQVGRRRLQAGMRLALGAGEHGFVLGTTKLRLRLAGEDLAPERPLARAPRHAVTLLLAALLWGWVLAGFAVQIDPGSRFTDWLVPLAGVPFALAGWCVLWGLASKLFQHRFDFWPHLAVAARGLLAMELVAFALPWAAALTSFVLLSRVATGASAACAVAMLLGHARLVAPPYQRALRVVGWSGFGVGVAVLLTLNQQRLDRWFSELYVSALPPPALLWVKPLAREEFVRDAAALRAPLDAAVREAERDARAGRDDEGD